MRLLATLVVSFNVLVAVSQQPVMPDTDVNNQPGQLSFTFGSLSFFRNNEFRNPITKGYTLTGSHLRPLLSWAPVEGLEIKGGLSLSIWSGYDGSPIIKPVFSTSLNLFDEVRITIGSLDGPDKHNMFDPHFDSEKLYSDFQEEGFQFLVGKEHFFSDTWVNWEMFTFWGDRHREELTFGESLRFFAGEPGAKLRFEFPVQVLARHWGGDISIYTEPVETHLNLAGGVRMIVGSDPGSGNGTGIEATAFTYIKGRDMSDIEFNDSYGLWFRGDHTFGDIFVTAGIWVSNNFHSPNGNRMFSSISNYLDGVTVPRRTLLTGSINYTKSHKTGFFSFLQGFDWYYDINEKRFDYTMTLHIRLPERSYGLSRHGQ
ncbi:MAG: hypothetical protein IH591_16160 [Bacteroidales bacterium]|nr:hypothetical protein [Bacteroidales bacterium]